MLLNLLRVSIITEIKKKSIKLTKKSLWFDKEKEDIVSYIKIAQSSFITLLIQQLKTWTIILERVIKKIEIAK